LVGPVAHIKGGDGWQGENGVLGENLVPGNFVHHNLICTVPQWLEAADKPPPYSSYGNV